MSESTSNNKKYTITINGFYGRESAAIESAELYVEADSKWSHFHIDELPPCWQTIWKTGRMRGRKRDEIGTFESFLPFALGGSFSARILSQNIYTIFIRKEFLRLAILEVDETRIFISLWKNTKLYTIELSEHFEKMHLPPFSFFFFSYYYNIEKLLEKICWRWGERKFGWIVFEMYHPLFVYIYYSIFKYL